MSAISNPLLSVIDEGLRFGRRAQLPPEQEQIEEPVYDEGPSIPAPSKQKPLPAPPTETPQPKVSPGLLETAGSYGLSGLAVLGSAVDLPLSSLRDVATWVPGGIKANNPFDQWLMSPLSSDHRRTEARQLLRSGGWISKHDTWGNFLGSIALESAVDPLTYTGLGVMSKGGKAIKAMHGVDFVDSLGNKVKFDGENIRQLANKRIQDIAKQAGKKAPSPLGRVGAWSRVTPEDILDSFSYDPKLHADIKDEYARRYAKLYEGKVIPPPTAPAGSTLPQATGRLYDTMLDNNQDFAKAVSKPLTAMVSFRVPGVMKEPLEFAKNPRSTLDKYARSGDDLPPAAGAATGAGPSPGTGPSPGAAGAASGASPSQQAATPEVFANADEYHAKYPVGGQYAPLDAATFKTMLASTATKSEEADAIYKITEAFASHRGETLDEFVAKKIAKVEKIDADIQIGRTPTAGTASFRPLLDDGRAVVRAFQQQDVSTMLHEMLHVYRKNLRDDLQKDADEWAGVEKNKPWTTEQEERWAVLGEKYLQTGKAPTEGLKKVFEDFKQWLTVLYATVTGNTTLKVNAKLKSVFDEMLKPAEGFGVTKPSAATPPVGPVVGAVPPVQAATEAVPKKSLKEKLQAGKKPVSTEDAIIEGAASYLRDPSKDAHRDLLNKSFADGGVLVEGDALTAAKQLEALKIGEVVGNEYIPNKKSQDVRDYLAKQQAGSKPTPEPPPLGPVAGATPTVQAVAEPVQNVLPAAKPEASAVPAEVESKLSQLEKLADEVDAGKVAMPEDIPSGSSLLTPSAKTPPLRQFIKENSIQEAATKVAPGIPVVKPPELTVNNKGKVSAKNASDFISRAPQDEFRPITPELAADIKKAGWTARHGAKNQEAAAWKLEAESRAPLRKRIVESIFDFGRLGDDVKLGGDVGEVAVLKAILRATNYAKEIPSGVKELRTEVLSALDDIVPLTPEQVEHIEQVKDMLSLTSIHDAANEAAKFVKAQYPSWDGDADDLSQRAMTHFLEPRYAPTMPVKSRDAVVSALVQKMRSIASDDIASKAGKQIAQETSGSDVLATAAARIEEPNIDDLDVIARERSAINEMDSQDAAEVAARSVLQEQTAQSPQTLLQTVANKTPGELRATEWREKQINSPAFMRWFGDWKNDPANASKVVDADGKPLDVYHGTPNSGFVEFSHGISQKLDSGYLGKGFYFTTKADTASYYSQSRASYKPGIYKVFLSIKNPLVLSKKALSPVELLTDESLPSAVKARFQELFDQGMADEQVKPFSPNDWQSVSPGAYEIQDSVASEAFTKAAKEGGYDGVEFTFKNGEKEIVAFYPEQIKSATANSGEFDPSKASVLLQTIKPIPGTEPDDLGFYSKAARVIRDKIGGATTYEQLIRTLVNNGVKQEEIDDLAFDLLKDKNKITRQDLIDHLNQNLVTVKQVLSNTTAEENYLQSLSDEYWEVAQELNKSSGLDVDLFEEFKVLSNDEISKLERRLEELGKKLREAEGLKPQYEEYQIPGGDPGTYKELLIQKGGGYKGSEPYTQSHFANKSNILAHVRMDDVTLPDKSKMLRIQEVQSDWHQRALKMQSDDIDFFAANSGEDDFSVQELKERLPLKNYYNTKERRAALSAKYKALEPRIAQAHKKIKTIREALEESYRYEESLSGLADDEWSKSILRKSQQSIRDSLNDAKRDLDVVYTQVAKVKDELTNYTVPDAPFKKSWEKLALKRILTYAAEHGYDSIGIVDGKDIAKVVGGPQKALGKFYNDKLTNELKVLTKNHRSYQGLSSLASVNPPPKWIEVRDGEWIAEGHRPEMAILYETRNVSKPSYIAYLNGIPIDIEHATFNAAKQTLREAAFKEFSGDINHFAITPAMRQDILESGQTLYQAARQTTSATRTAQHAKEIADNIKSLAVQSGSAVKSWFKNLPDDKALMVADILDKGIDIIEGLPGMNRLKALFRADTWGFHNVEGQQVAEVRTKAYHDGWTEVRRVMAPAVHDLYKVALNEDDLARSIAEANPAMPRKEVLNLAAKSMNERALAMVDYIELARKKPNKDYLDVFGPDKDLVRQNLDLMIRVLGERRVAEAASGLKAALLRDPEADYFPRQMVRESGSAVSPFKGSVLETTGPFQEMREDWLRELPGGVRGAQLMSIDPKVSGILHDMPAEADLLPDPVFQDARQYVFDKYGKLLGVTDPKLINQLNSITAWVTRLSPWYRETQMPYFGRNPLHAIMERVEHSVRVEHMALGGQELIGRHAEWTPKRTDDIPQPTRIDKVMSDLNFSAPQAAHNVIEQMGKQSEYAVHAKDKVDEVMATLSVDKLVKDGYGGTLVSRNGKIFLITEEMVPNKEIIEARVANKAIEKANKKLPAGTDPQPLNPTDKVRTVEEELVDIPGKTPDAPVKTVADQIADRMRAPYTFLENYSLPRQLANDIRSTLSSFETPKEVHVWEELLGRFTNLMRAHMTGPFPAFHNRNLLGGQVLNFILKAAVYDHIANPAMARMQPIADAWNLYYGKDIPDIEKRVIEFSGMTNAQANKALREMVFAEGVVGSSKGISAEVMGQTMEKFASQYPGLVKHGPLNVPQPPPGSTLLDIVNPGHIRGGMAPALQKEGGKARLVMAKYDDDAFLLTRWGRGVGSLVEFMNRMPVFLAQLTNGNSAAQAAKRASDIHFDYNNLSQFERRRMRFLIPFYVFSSRILGLTASELMHNPGGMMAQAIRVINRGRDKTGTVPDYVQETASIPWPGGPSEDGTKSYITGFGLPFEDPAPFAKILTGDVTAAAREVASRMNPLVKGPIEALFKRSLFYEGPFGGKELSDLDPPIGRTVANFNQLLTGEKTEGRADPFISTGFEHFMANMPSARYSSTLRTATDWRKWENPLMLAANLMTGVRVAQISPASQDIALRDTMARVLKEHGGTTISLPYLSPSAEKRLTEEELDNAKEAKKLISELGKRSRERNKARREAEQIQKELQSQ